MEKIMFIVNPKSGVRRIKRTEQLVARYLDHQKFQSEIVYTQYAHHGTQLAREGAAQGYDIIVAVGGDGSVNDVANGLVHTQTRLAILPQGSGNGLARSLGIPLNPGKALGLINKNHTMTIDLGKIDNKLFISNTGVGFDVLIAEQFRNSVRRGLMMYSWLAFKQLWTYKAKTYDLLLDGQLRVSSRAFILSIANAREFGYGFKIAPTAKLNDGLLDITLLKPFPKLFSIGIVLRAFTGTLLHSRYVSHYQAAQITILQPGIARIQLDGDFHSHHHDKLQVSILKDAIKIITPAP